MAQSPKHPFANVLLSKNLDHCSTGRSLHIRIEKMVLTQERATVAFQPGSDREIIRFSYRCSRKEGIRRDNEKRNFLLEYQPEGSLLMRERTNCQSGIGHVPRSCASWKGSPTNTTSKYFWEEWDRMLIKESLRVQLPTIVYHSIKW